MSINEKSIYNNHLRGPVRRIDIKHCGGCRVSLDDGKLPGQAAVTLHKQPGKLLERPHAKAVVIVIAAIE